MANSDIIKIGFDYRASLAQFEKDTNGVFDGISNKAGKQRITIQLDAKDDKVIDKIKELQKLKLDKFTFEFGDSGLKEQLQTFDKLENKINEIINLGKGKSFIDSSPTVTDIGKIENKINELNKKYEEAQKKLSSIGSGDISGKDVNLVDNAEFQKLTQEVSKLKNQFDDLKIHIQLLDDCTVPTDRFFELQSQVEGATARVSDLVDEFTKLSNAQKVLSSTPQESNISSENSSLSQLNKEQKELDEIAIKLQEIKEIENKIASKKELGEDFRMLKLDLDLAKQKLKDLTAVKLQEELKDILGTTDIWYRRVKSMSELLADTGGYFSNSLLSASSYFDVSDYRQQMIAGQIDTSKFFKLDAQGNQWNSLEKVFTESELGQKFKELGISVDEFIEKYHIRVDLGAKYTTEFVANVAKELGYLGIIFENINDNSIFNANGTILPATTTSVQVFDSSALSNVKNITNLLLGTSNIIEDINNEELAKTQKVGGDLISQITKVQQKLIELRKTTDGKGTSTSKLENIKQILLEIQSVDFKNLDKISQEQLTNKLESEISKLKKSSGVRKFSEIYSSIINDIENELSKIREQIANPIKDVFQGDKIDQVTTSAKDLDKTLKQVDIPTDSFDKVLEKLDRTKSELVDIVKITKQSVSDADGKFHDSYTLKDGRGSTEIYGVNSKTDKGQILRQNIVGYDVKKDTVDNSKELLAIEKQLQKEIETSDKANQKKFQDFQKEQANYEESVNKVNSAIQKTDEILDTLPLHDKLDGQFLDMIDSVDNLNSKLKSGEFTLSEYKNEVKSVTSEYSKMVSIQQKRDVEDYKANAKANLENAKNIKAEWDKNLKAIQDYMDAVTKLNNLKAKDKGTGSEANQIALQTQNVEELKQAAWDARKNLSSMQAENPDIIAWKQWVDMMELFDQASKGSAESAAKLKDALNNIKVPSLDKYENKLSSYLNKTGGYDATIARFNDGGWTSDTYLKNVQAVRDAVKQYSTLLNNIKTNQNGIASDEDIQNLDEYEKKIKDTIATVTNMSASEKGYSQLAGQKEIDKINKILRENSAMSSEAKAKIKAYKQELISGNPSVSLEKIHGEIMKIVNAEELAGRAGRSMFDVIKEKAFYGFAAQIGMYFGFNDIVNGFKQAASTVTELNTQITELAKVSEQSSKQIYADFDSYADIAKEVRGTISDTIAATADWSKNGYSIPDAKQLAEISQLYKNVGDGIDIDTANESLISTLKGFQLEADQAEHIVDVFNKVSKNIGEVA